MLRDKKVILTFIMPGLVLFTGFFLVPLFFSLLYSFTDWKGYGPLNFIGFRNYYNLIINDPLFWRGVKNTFIIFFIAVIGQILPGFIFAVLLTKIRKGLKFFKTAYFIPVVLSTVAVSLLWDKIYDVRNGLLNESLRLIGLEILTREWLNLPNVVIYLVAIPIAWQYMGYHMIILYAGLKSIDRQYLEAAYIDGATEKQALFHITLPLLKPILKVSLVLAALGSLRIFDHVYILTKGGPYNSSITVALQMYNEAFLKQRFGYGSSIAILLLVECIVILFIVNKLLTGKRLEY